MDSDSDTGDVPSDPKRPTRRRHRYLFALIPAILLALTMIISGTRSCTALGAYSGISFDLTPVLAHASLPVHVRACIPSSCASFTVEHWGSEGLAVCDGAKCPPLPAPNAAMIQFIDDQRQRDWWITGILVVQVNDPELTSWRPITVRLRLSDQAGNSTFDSSTLVKPHMFQPNGPGCDPTTYSERVVATPTGRLVPQP